MSAYLTRMPCGIAGDVSRKGPSVIEPNPMNSDYPVLLYGVPVKMVDQKVLPLESGDGSVAIYGFSVRPYPFMAEVSEALDHGTPNINQPLDVLKSGYMTVKCNAGVCVRGSTVYVRVTSSGLAAQPIGGLEAAADGGDCVAITGTIFLGTADADGNVEIAYNV